MRGMAEEKEEGEREGEESRELGMGGRHAIALAVHLCLISIDRESVSSQHLRSGGAEGVRRERQGKGEIRFGRSSLIKRLRRKFKASQPI